MILRNQIKTLTAAFVAVVAALAMTAPVERDVRVDRWICHHYIS